MPALPKIFWAALPHGTVSAQRTTLTSGLARSASVATFAGLPGGTAISRTFVAKGFVALTRLLSSGSAAAVAASAVTVPSREAADAPDLPGCPVPSADEGVVLPHADSSRAASTVTAGSRAARVRLMQGPP